MATINKPRVLICDDRESQYKKIRSFLEHQGFECEARVDRRDQVRIMLQESYHSRRFYHAVMLDVDLKGKQSDWSGIQLYEELAESYPNEDYILYSSMDTRQLRDQINRLRFRDVEIVLLDELTKSTDVNLAFFRLFNRDDHRRVFLVFGQHESKNRQMSRFLNKALGLEVVAWEDAKSKSRSNFILDIVIAGMQDTAATVVLFTDDEDVRLKGNDRRRAETLTRRQARPNVYLEAGYALGIRQKRTVLVEWPDERARFAQPSDLHGIHMERFDGKPSSRRALRKRLEAARCVLRPAKDWLRMRL